jgi:outer membrane protein
MKREILKRVSLTFGLLLSAVALYGQAAGARVAIISIQEAVSRTQEGQKLANDLQVKYKPTQDKLQKQRNDIATLRDQLNKGANTMSDEAKRDLIRQVQTKERDLQRDTEDAQTDFNAELQQFQQAMLNKVIAVTDKFAKEKGFSLVLDISSPQSPVFYAVNEINITNDVIKLYDQEYPVGAQAAPAGAATKAPAAKPQP